MRSVIPVSTLETLPTCTHLPPRRVIPMSILGRSLAFESDNENMSHEGFRNPLPSKLPTRVLNGLSLMWVESFQVFCDSRYLGSFGTVVGLWGVLGQ